MTSVLLPLLAGAILGFASHRAGLCTVKAAAEIFTSHRGFFLWSFVKSAAWVMALTAVVGMFGHATQFTHWPLTGLSIIGGVFFGLGAGLNGGCTFSTLTRAVDGNLGLWATVAAWPMGMWVASRLPLSHPDPIVVPQPDYPVWILILLVLALLGEGFAIVRRFWRKQTFRRVIGASVYTLSAGAALVGLSNAVIVEVNGTWSFSSTILCGIDARSSTSCANPLMAWSIVIAAIAGMVLSSLQRGSFRLHLPPVKTGLRHGAGGLLMGMGTVLIPGGNDGLILFAIPSLSPHAIPAYTGIFAGILAVMLMMHVFGGRVPHVKCTGDICRMQ